MEACLLILSNRIELANPCFPMILNNSLWLLVTLGILSCFCSLIRWSKVAFWFSVTAWTWFVCNSWISGILSCSWSFLYLIHWYESLYRHFLSLCGSGFFLNDSYTLLQQRNFCFCCCQRISAIVIYLFVVTFLPFSVIACGYISLSDPQLLFPECSQWPSVISSMHHSSIPLRVVPRGRYALICVRKLISWLSVVV